MRLLRLVLALLLGYAVAAGPSTATTTTGQAAPAPIAGLTPEPRVLVISVDGLASFAVRRVGPEGAPTIFRLLREGAKTLNARTVVESTETLPNHTSMVTGHRVRADRGGHGVSWNGERPGSTVRRAAGRSVGSVFSRAHRAGTTALFTTKRKLSIFNRSWPIGIDRFTRRDNRDWALMRAARADLVAGNRVLTFVHFGRADQVGHASGYGTAPYYRAVRQVDGLVGALIHTVETRPELAGTRVILTADHGGWGKEHDNPTRLVNYRIPFVVWGPGVRAGNLYSMNPEYASPGRRRVGYAGAQPIRNGDVANLALDLLGLGPVPKSQFDVRQTLDWN